MLFLKLIFIGQILGWESINRNELCEPVCAVPASITKWKIKQFLVDRMI